MNRWKKAAVMVLMVALTTSVGCFTAVKQVYYGLSGAEGSFYEVRVVEPRILADYPTVTVEPFTNELGDHVPLETIRQINEQVPRALAESGLFEVAGRPLRITGRIVHYTGQSGLKGSVGSVLGGADECICRVQILDGESGTVVGEAVCWGSVKSAIRRGQTEIGGGVAKAILKWIDQRLPEDTKQKRKTRS